MGDQGVNQFLSLARVSVRAPFADKKAFVETFLEKHHEEASRAWEQARLEKEKADGKV